MNRSCVLPVALGAAICAVLLVLAPRMMGLAPADPAIGVETEGRFVAGGVYPGTPLRDGSNIRQWGSWAGDDANRGSIALGPFVAPETITLALSGYPLRSGNSIVVQLAGTAERHAFMPRFDIGERWRTHEIPVPPNWVGKPVTLIATDNSQGPGGWLGISEPLAGGRAAAVPAFIATLAAWCTNALLLGILWFAAAQVLAGRASLPPHWLPIVAAAVVATAGYVCFWAYFASPWLGKLTSGFLLGAALFTLFRRRQTSPTLRHVRFTGTLMFGIGLFYVSLLHLFPSSREFYDLAANRFREELPADNSLPHSVAVAAYAGDTLRPPGADWLTSDRPPLQSGWQLLTLPVLAAVSGDAERATGTAAIWLQLLWVPAVYGLFCMLGMRQGRAAMWVVVLSLSGFFLQNTVFTWPKLSAAAFGCCAFALWFLERRSAYGGSPKSGNKGDRYYGIGAALAGLAWLSHGGIAFSFVPLGLWIVWRMLRGEIRGWLLAAGIFALFSVPWFAYQKFYNPPGDRLLKWHLGGQQAKDPRSVFTVVREAYRATPPAKIVEAKLSNFEFQVIGNWAGLFSFNAENVSQRRDNEFFGTGRALSWWVAGLAALAVAAVSRGRRRQLAERAREHAAVAVWIVATIVAWCLLMFSPYSACVHQGSYATMLGLFVLLSAWLDLASRWLIYAAGLLQVATLATTWAGPNPQVHGAPDGWPLVAVSAGIMLWLLFRPCAREVSPLDAATDAMRPLPSRVPGAPAKDGAASQAR